MLTLVHEDIYVYIDKIEEIIKSKTGANTFAFSNDSKRQIADPGIFYIEIKEGEYNSLSIEGKYNTVTLTKPLPKGTIILLDFRNSHFKVNGEIVFLDDVFRVQDDDYQEVALHLSGQGEAKVKYFYLSAVENDSDLFFCTSLDVTEAVDIIKGTNVKNQTKLLKTAKKDYTWSINGLWNRDEIGKFASGTKFLRLRFIDEEQNHLETLSNCFVSNVQRGSSEDADYAYSISGTCEGIF